MLDFLQTVWNLLSGVAISLWGLVSTVLVFAGDLLVQLHTTAPRLEGLLVGVLLAWLMVRRDKHPLLRVLSAPLKLVVDILDLAWDQASEVVSDLWKTATGWVSGVYGWIKGKVVGGYNQVMKLLVSLKDRLVSLGKKSEGE